MTQPHNTPRAFADALQSFAASLRANFSTAVPANPEDQLKPPVQALLQSVAIGVQPRTEAQVEGLGGRPDIGVAVRGLLSGFVELKAPGKGARTNRFRGADKKQWEKFKALPNLLYTDGNEWALYRSGEPTSEVVRFAGDVTVEGAAAFDEEATARLHGVLLDFLNWQPIAPNSPRALAQTLAPLCRLLREDVLAATNNSESNLAQLAGEWRVYLFPDADDAQFADAYAQTLTYALLLARLNGESQLSTVTAAAALDSGHGLLAQTLRVLTQPAAREEIKTGVDLLERIIAAVDPAQLQRRGDPWLYFYEDFLAEYDPELRRKRGVYYTPMQVIGAKVRLVAELLSHHFNKPLTFADEDVVFLDPAAGTAAYPVAAIEYALEKVAERYGEGMVAARATECARNFNAFEILVGPYAVAHLRLTQIVRDSGGTTPADGVQVFLTDTLESPHADPPQPNLFARRLTEEHRRAQRVKRSKRVLVCMGNPPYEREQREVGDNEGQERKGGWVRYGDPDNPDNRPILQDFIELATEAGAGVHVKNLYNDYVYFWRWALWKLFENPEASGPGIVALITPSSYLRGPGFAGMRRKMRECFDELWVIDLEGDNRGARRTENVFPTVQTPVAIAIGVRYGEARPATAASVRYTKLTGTGEEKLEQLRHVRGFADLVWRDCYRGWMQPFLPEGAGDYYSWPLLSDLFPWQHSGVQFKRTWPIGATREVLLARWEELLRGTGAARREAFRETRDRKIDRQYMALDNPTRRLPTVDSLTPGTPPINQVRYAFRSFDRQWALVDSRLGDFLRPQLWRTQSSGQIYLSTLLTTELGIGPAAVVSSSPPDMNSFNNRACHAIPMWRDADVQQPNVTRGLLDTLRQGLGEEISAEDLFCYCYAILALPAYVEKFSEELTVPGPRMPLTRDAQLFRRATELGRTFIWFHTFGERFVPPNHRHGEIPQGRARCTRGVPTTPEGYPEEFSYDPERQLLRVGAGEFQPVSREVWEFSVSGLNVLESWLNYRKKAGAGRQFSPLDRIRPAQWAAAMTQELLELIWVLEATIERFPQLSEVFNTIIESPTFIASELPQPDDEERKPPAEAEEDAGQHELPM